MYSIADARLKPSVRAAGLARAKQPQSTRRFFFLFIPVVEKKIFVIFV